MALSVAAQKLLVEEYHADPLKLGYGAIAAASGDWQVVAAALLLPRESILVDRGVISRTVFVGDCERLGVWGRLLALQGTSPTHFAGWAFYLQFVLPLLDEFSVSGDTFGKQLAGMVADGLLTADQVPLLTQRPGSRAEQLLGLQPSVSDVADALSGEKP